MESATNPRQPRDSHDGSGGGIRGEIVADIAAGEDPRHPFRRFLRRVRAWIHRRPRLRIVYRVLVAVVGATLSLVGLALVPLPGPGWLVVFLGLAVLGTEFVWAHRLAAVIKRLLARFWAWWTARRRARTSAAR